MQQNHLTEVRLNHLRNSDIAESILQLGGRPYSLTNYPMFRDIFNSMYSRKVMRAGRQVSKSITIASEIVTGACSTPYLPTQYTNASANQTKQFSTSKLDPMLLLSPVVHHNFMKNKEVVINNVYSKRLSNFSEVFLSYFSDSADRVRGNTAWRIYFDEVQDMLYDAMIDVQECASASPDKRFVYAGTSKTMVTTLEFLWGLSTQKQWIIKCGGCNKWNTPSIDNIGKKGLVCKKCGHALNTYEGHWHSFGPEGTIYDGFHIPQIILPLHCCNETAWNDILFKLEKYPEYKFKNEVMGIPMGEGDSPLTEQLLKDICIDKLAMDTRRTEINTRGAAYIVAGVDWGGSGMSGTSRTVLSIYAVWPEKPEFIKIFGKIYSSGEPTQHVSNIAHMLRGFNAHACYGDHGGGNFAMSQLANEVPHIRIIPVMYTDQAAPYKWDEHAKRFTVNRTNMIDAFIMDLKKKWIRAFRWEEFKPFAEDILNIRESIVGEERGKGRRIWVRYPMKPDDSLHSMVFGWFGARVMSGMLEFTV